MKRNGKNLPHIMVILGIAMMTLRQRLAFGAVDEKGLLTAGHPLTYVLLAVAAVCMVLAILAALRMEESSNFAAASSVSALGDCIFGLAIGLVVLRMGFGTSMLERICAVVGILCVPGLLYSAWCRIKGKPVFFGSFAVVCVFMALYLVGRYRVWSSNPQLLDYLFAMISCVSLTMFAYQNAALCVGSGSRRMWLASGLLTISFGAAALYAWDTMALYLGSVIWGLTTLLGAQVEENG